LTFHADPGHAWLQVPIALLERLGIAEKITRYSYMDSPSESDSWMGSNAYLEEDVDANTFVTAADAAGIQFAVKHAYAENTPIRDYPSYRCEPGRIKNFEPHLYNYDQNDYS
jgi:hypothetical protein